MSLPWKRRKKRPGTPRAPVLYISRILQSADGFHRRWGHWPTGRSGRIPETVDDNWRRIDTALRLGLRGLPGGSSLADLLAEQRGVRKASYLPPLSEKQILAWADLYHRRKGQWPILHSGSIPGSKGETWRRVDSALRLGLRGLPGRSSLPELLAQRRGARNPKQLPCLTEARILRWADIHRQRTGKWPRDKSGPIIGEPRETWLAVDSALRYGRRGWPGGSSLAQFLAAKRGVPNQKQLPRLTLRDVLLWADQHCRRWGAWPRRNSGPILLAPSETWAKVNSALSQGLRGLPGGSSLFRFLKKHRRI